MSDRTFGCPAPSTGVPPLLRPRRALVLVNARSRSGERAPAVERALAALVRAGTACLHESCASSEELAPLIRRHAAEGAVDAVVIGGGDGTLNAAAPALLDTGLPLGILPLGTANDLARTLGLPLDPVAAAQVIAAGRTRRIDLGLVNGHPFFNIASIGLSVAVTGELTAARKRRWGRLAYVVAAVQALARARPFSAVIARDGSPPERVRTVQIAVGNGRYYGGGMAVCAAAAWSEDCVAVVSISAQHHNDDRIRDGIRAAKAGFAAPGALDRLARHHGDEARWVLDSWTETWLSPAFADFTLAPCRAAVRCPVLALHGAADEYGTPDHARAIAGPDGALDVMPGLGHFPHREAEAAVVDRIAGFLAPLP